MRNIAVLQIAAELEKRAAGQLKVKVYHGAAKHKDTDVPKALNQGAIDMGIPVTFHLGKFVSDFDAVDLPLFYGRTREEIYKVTDGEVGKALAAKLEKKLGVKVVGKWMDLGHQQTYTINKPLNSWKDLHNLKIRTPGGAGNIQRFHMLGANPIKIAWPDVPAALQRGTMDGLMTTSESVRSAKLWDSGLRHAYPVAGRHLARLGIDGYPPLEFIGDAESGGVANGRPAAVATRHGFRGVFGVRCVSSASVSKPSAQRPSASSAMMNVPTAVACAKNRAIPGPPLSLLPIWSEDCWSDRPGLGADTRCDPHDV